MYATIITYSSEIELGHYDYPFYGFKRKNDHLWPYLEIRTQKSQHVGRQGDTIEQITFTANDQFKPYLL